MAEENPQVTANSAPPENDENPWQTGALRFMEIGIVGSLAVLLVALAIHVCIWVGFGVGEPIHLRVARAIRAINENWKFDLIVLVLLFFRPIRKFLENMKKGPFGSEVHDGTAPPPPSGGYGGGQAGAR